ncbi:MAG: hypothetical protein E7117_06700 [Bacteroidales bacterium]|nr:hypothetical protein [Bacteroidales bacterium]
MKSRFFRRFIYVTVPALIILLDVLPANAGKWRNPFAGRDVGTGITFGYVHSAYRTVDWVTDDVIQKEGLNGLYVGLNHDISLIKDALYLETGLYYTWLNENRRDDIFGLRVVGDRSEHMLSVPVRLKYVFNVARDIDVFLYGGPTFVAGVASDLTYRTRLPDGSTAALTYDYYKCEMNSTDNLAPAVEEWFGSKLPGIGYDRFDVLAGGAVGAEFFDVLEVHIGYDWGLVNRTKGELESELKMRRQQFYVSIGLRF